MPGRTILVIDYDPESVESTSQALVGAGYRVEVAKDGVEGIQAFERLKPDLVLIEPMVPKKHGFQVCREIKGSTHGRSVPVLITTAFYKGRKHKASAREEFGCDDYLEKPIAPDELLAACRRWVPEPSAPAPAAPVREAVSGLVALDDLSDDEIGARLDAMIDAVTGTAAVAVVRPPQPAAAPPASVRPAADERKTPVPTVAVTEAVRRTARPAGRATATPPAPLARVPARPPARARSAESAMLTSGTTRAIVASAPAPPRRPHTARYLVAGLVLAAAAGVAWMLVVRDEPATSPEVLDAGPRRPAPLPPERGRDEPARDAPVAERAGSAPAGTANDGTVAIPVEIAADTAQADHGAPIGAPPLEVAPAHGSAAERGSERPVGPGRPATAKTAPPAVDPPSAVRGSEHEGASTGVQAATPEPAPAPVEAQATVTAAEHPGPVVERGELFRLADVDEPPVPIRKDAPVYPPMARNLRQEGTVTLRLLVDETGGVERVEVVQSLDGRLLDSAALRAAKDWRYQPATEQGVAVKVWITEQVVFRL